MKKILGDCYNLVLKYCHQLTALCQLMQKLNWMISHTCHIQYCHNQGPRQRHQDNPICHHKSSRDQCKHLARRDTPICLEDRRLPKALHNLKRMKKKNRHHSMPAIDNGIKKILDSEVSFAILKGQKTSLISLINEESRLLFFHDFAPSSQKFLPCVY